MTFSFGPTKTLPGSSELAIRLAAPEDMPAVERLAVMDSSRAPRGDVLIALVEDELWAAVSIDDFHAVADPFRPSADTVLVLIERARQVRRAERQARRGSRSARRIVRRPHAV